MNTNELIELWRKRAQNLLEEARLEEWSIAYHLKNQATAYFQCANELESSLKGMQFNAFPTST